MPFRGRLASCPSTGLTALVCVQLAACTARPAGHSAPSQSAPPVRPTARIPEAPVRSRTRPRSSSERASADDRAEANEATAPPSGTSSPMESLAEGTGLDLSTGAVAFRGLDAGQLANIQIIPEQGAALLPAADGTFEGVDGLWLRGERRWFKIPGGTRVVVSRPSADPPAAPAADSSSGTQRTVIAGELVFQIISSAASTVYQRMKGPGAMAGWQPDEGSSAHPTDYPF